jgi:diacylglycerol kinase family enzyme
VKLVLSEFQSFQPLELTLVADGKEVLLRSFMLTLANGSQFGNNAMIAPEADMKDGNIDVCSMKKFPFYVAPGLIYLLMKNRINRSQYYSMFRAKDVMITATQNMVAHLDGEVAELGTTVHAVIVPEALKIITP